MSDSLNKLKAVLKGLVHDNAHARRLSFTFTFTLLIRKGDNHRADIK